MLPSPLCPLSAIVHDKTVSNCNYFLQPVFDIVLLNIPYPDALVTDILIKILHYVVQYCVKEIIMNFDEFKNISLLFSENEQTFWPNRISATFGRIFEAALS